MTLFAEQILQDKRRCQFYAKESSFSIGKSTSGIVEVNSILLFSATPSGTSLVEGFSGRSLCFVSILSPALMFHLLTQ